MAVLASRSPFFALLFRNANFMEKQARVDGLPSLDFRDNFEDVRDLVLMIYGLL